MNATSGNTATRSRASKLLTGSLALAASLVTVVALSGCGGNAVEKSMDGGGDTQVQGQLVDTSGLPEGFPDSVPVFNGKITYENVLEMGDTDMWTVVMEVPDSVETYAEVKAQLEGAGFTEESNSADGDVIIGSFGGRNDYSVTVSTEKTLTYELTYVVMEF